MGAVKRWPLWAMIAILAGVAVLLAWTAAMALRLVATPQWVANEGWICGAAGAALIGLVLWLMIWGGRQE